MILSRGQVSLKDVKEHIYRLVYLHTSLFLNIFIMHLHTLYFTFCLATDQTARKKWTALRDYFKKAHRQLTVVKSGAPAEKKKNGTCTTI